MSLEEAEENVKKGLMKSWDCTEEEALKVVDLIKTYVLHKYPPKKEAEV